MKRLVQVGALATVTVVTLTVGTAPVLGGAARPGAPAAPGLTALLAAGHLPVPSQPALAENVQFDPSIVEFDSGTIGEPITVPWVLVNQGDPTVVRVKGGPLGSLSVRENTISEGETHTYTAEVPPGATELVVENLPQVDGALDLTILKDGEVLAHDDSGTALKKLVIDDPEPGEYTYRIFARELAGGSGPYFHTFWFLAPQYGRLRVHPAPILLPAGGEAPVHARVIPGAVPVEGHWLVAEARAYSAITGTFLDFGYVIVYEVKSA